jgi:L-ascorbate metabolism protein UlaG (beta-lactamase superfamily)
MSIRLTWLGHSAWQLQVAGATIQIDPFLTGNPAAQVAAETLAADFICLTHGHGDHLGDTAEIARRTSATVVCNYEIATWLGEKHGISRTAGLNLGGWMKLPMGRVQHTLAWHSSSLPDGTYGGNPGGYLFELDGKRLYFAGDTALFSDMSLIGAAGLDLAVVPIGDFYTMGPEDSVRAIQLLRPRLAAPTHYNTWPPIAQDNQAWAAAVRKETSAEPLTPQVGEVIEL